MKFRFFFIEESTQCLFSTEATQRHHRGHRGHRGENAMPFSREVTEALLFFLLMLVDRIMLYKLNLPTNNLPEAMITRWIGWIQLLYFNLFHVPGKQHSLKDNLSSCRGTE